jgi:hypothetical protein
MGLRVSGKNALVQLQRGSGTEFDISGTDTDGRSRSNQFEFSITPEMARAFGFNEDWKESVPLGQREVSGSMTAFYNSASDEVEDYLWTMHEEQHEPSSCSDPQEYTMYIMPEGDCTGKTKYTVSNVILGELNMSPGPTDIMVIEFNWEGWEVSKATIT